MMLSPYHRLHHFRGGVALEEHKKEPPRLPVVAAQLPARLYLPLQQYVGEPLQPLVNVGDRVLKGQKIADSNQPLSAPLHAPSSGVVAAIEDHPLNHPSGLTGPTLVIETDGLEQWRLRTQTKGNYKHLSPAELRSLIHEAGIVGLGGAGFPSHVKLNSRDKPVEMLIINGAECEPYITCDEMLMREQPWEIVAGMLMMRHATGAQKCVIAIENNKPEAYEALRAAVEYTGVDGVDVIAVPTVYPAGGEKQLIQVLTGKEVPFGGIPLDIGVVCQNVGTAYAVYRAVELGEPLLSRYVTIAGGVAKRRNLEVLIGTPVSELIEQCGGSLKTLDKVVIGGPMMGYALHHLQVPVVKTTNCVLAATVADMPLSHRGDAMPCIRCGACMEACPMGLLPQQLFWYARAKEMDRIQDLHLFDCIECGCCDYVCPSHIPLVQYYRYAKTEIWQQERDKQRAELSKRRHDQRLERQEQERLAKEERHRQKKAALQALKGDNQAAEQDAKKAAIQAALQRARQKQEQAEPKNTTNLTPEQQKMIDEVERRRQQKKTAKDGDSPAGEAE